MQARIRKTRISKMRMPALEASSKQSRNHSTSTESQSSNPFHLGAWLMTNQVGIMVEDCFLDHDCCTLVVNGSKIALTRRSLRLTRKELDRLLHTYADIVWQRYCASRKKMTTGTRLARQLRVSHQRWKASQPSHSSSQRKPYRTILSELSQSTNKTKPYDQRKRKRITH